MATLAELLEVRSLRTESEHAYLRRRLQTWLGGRTADSRPHDAGVPEVMYRPELYVPLDGVADRWLREGDEARRRPEMLADGRGAGDADGRMARAGRTDAEEEASASPEIRARRQGGEAERASAAWWVARAALPHVVLVGDPGGGKTVFLARFAATLAAACLGRPAGPKDPGLDALVRPRPGAGLRLPVLVAANRIAVGTPEEFGARLVEAIRKELHVDGVPRPTTSEVEVGLRTGRFVLLVDAFDEIRDAAQRDRFREFLQGPVAGGFPSTRVVLSTRSAPFTGVVESWDPFEVVRLQSLTDAQRERLAKNWVRETRCRPGYERLLLDAIATLRKDVPVGEGEDDLIANPFMLTAVCAVHWKHRTLPHDRTTLCRLIVRDLCRSRRPKTARGKAKAGASSRWKLNADRRQRILAALAWELLVGGKQRQGLRIEDAESVVGDTLPKKVKNSQARAPGYLRRTAEHTGLLVYEMGEDGEELRFRHRLFRDYLAACKLASDETEVSEKVRKLEQLGAWTDPSWNGVLPFLPRTLGSKEKAQALRAELLQLPGAIAGKRRGRYEGLAAQMVVANRGLYGGLDVAERARQMVDLYEREGKDWPMLDRLLFLEMVGLLDPKGGDPRLAEDSYRWVRIPGGRVKIEGKFFRVKVEPFEMAWAPVTVQEYRAFVEAADGGDERWWRGEGWATPEGELRRVHEARPEEWRGQQTHPNRPVTDVSWYEAMSYCRWRTAHDRRRRTIRLPTEAEWQRAAEGPERYEYPWGNEALRAGESAQANWEEAGVGGPSPAGAFPAGSRQGMVDLAGNIWEWCANVSEPNPWGRGLRGGSWALNDAPWLRCSRRDFLDPYRRSDYFGLRVAAAAGTR
ncbi:MAG: SUMF1/EgtB/PvdO family nonheme iron enzyme [Planctomycetes bacterium]|nr:SUMF1/EgtB/PvdO family nonheme iron enzyme [Planctomycetota bacterium]